ncbi:MAG: hypothetical protein E6Q97_27150 [Desulfurellales bacterium]|nr:MAG: hypothetical protein E6Q97_27150 [Desulfurellales bacterium]
MSDVIQTTVEVPESEVVSAPVVPTREDVKARGWTKAEIDSAEKLGIIAKQKKEEEKSEPKAEEKKAEVAEPVKESEAKAEDQKPVEKRASGIPEWNPPPELEKKLVDILPPGDPMRGMYFRMKNERTARQNLQAQLEKERAARAELEAKLNTAKETTVSESEDDPEDRPLTIRAIKELQLKEREENMRREQEINARAAAVYEAQKAQEEYAKEIHPDFDVVVKQAMEIIKNPDTIQEPWKRAKALKLHRELREAAANADSLGLDDYNGAMIAYEIGQLHPSYGQRAEQNGEVLKPEPKANGGHTPDQMKRIEENTLRRASSASVAGGGGRRVVSADDVTLADINKMDTRQRLNFREKHPDQYARLLRG